ncbi:hypothetical protein NAF17_03925 [Mucilaginibacter sp. RB4R14]|uniref:hypothetical protein n=1 Tax=Mucilaginibacter aurantiaciroseus TaxID=2949308 RepID=UPI002090A944|nr:hypothetical protein [Mucilaginibacter aurantiaciroseus]MCO5934680.1 hypothetical protein [Mucilaginibacter aurantiaciroseus]
MIINLLYNRHVKLNFLLKNQIKFHKPFKSIVHCTLPVMNFMRLKSAFKWVAFVAWFIPGAVLAQLKNLGLPEINNFSANEYHAHPNCFGAVQDQQGIMYFANLQGVLEYDGVKWRTITLPNSSSCTSLAADRNGRVYVGGRSEFGYLDKDSTGYNRYVSLLKHISPKERNFNEIWNTYITAEGVLFTSFEQLIFISKKKAKIYYPQVHFGKSFNVGGDIYITDNGRLMRFAGKTFIPVTWGSYFKYLFISGIVKISDKQFLVSVNSKGIFLVDGDKISSWLGQVNFSFSNYGLDKMIILDNRYIVISSQLSGLFITKLNGDIIYHIQEENGLAGDNVTGTYIDSEKNLWVTLINGITYIPLFKPFTFINERLKVTGIAYSSASINKKLYLATSEGVFYTSLLTNNPSFKKADISGLTWSLNNIDSLIFAGNVSGGYTLNDKQIRSVAKSGTWLYLLIQNNETVISGTYYGLEVFTKHAGKWVMKNKIKGFNESSRFLIEDKLGDIWVSHGNKGVFKLRLNKQLDSVTSIKTFNASNGLPFNFDNTVCKLNNEVVFATHTGVYRFNFDREQIEPYTALNAVTGKKNHIERIFQTDKSHFWIVFNGGSVSKVETDGRDHFKIIFSTNKFQGKLVNSFESIKRLDKDHIILSTQDGFAIYNEGEEDAKSGVVFNFKAFISEVELGASPYLVVSAGYNGNRKPILTIKQNSLRFSFSANHYEDAANTQYQFILLKHGEEEAWINKWSNDNYKDFTNLPAGDYILKLRARDNYGKISSVDTFKFEIEPPWFQETWAYTVYVVAFLFSVLFSARTIRGRFKKQRYRLDLQNQQILWGKEKELEQANLIAQRDILALQKANLEIEGISLLERERLLNQEKLIKALELEKEKRVLVLEKEKFQAEMEHKNNELTSLTLNITQKNEFLTKIKTQVNRVLKESTEADVKENLQQLEAFIHKGMQSNREWEKFKDHFDIVHNDVLNRLKEQYPDLKTSSLKLCAFLKMRLSTKQIAVLMNTSPDTVAKSRYRLRFRLKLEKGTMLSDFLNNF